MSARRGTAVAGRQATARLHRQQTAVQTEDDWHRDKQPKAIRTSKPDSVPTFPLRKP
jgi:hypothetical protein